MSNRDRDQHVMIEQEYQQSERSTNNVYHIGVSVEEKARASELSSTSVELDACPKPNVAAFGTIAVINTRLLRCDRHDGTCLTESWPLTDPALLFSRHSRSSLVFTTVHMSV